jgi:hypothetical protein
VQQHLCGLSRRVNVEARQFGGNNVPRYVEAEPATKRGGVLTDFLVDGLGEQLRELRNGPMLVAVYPGLGDAKTLRHRALRLRRLCPQPSRHHHPIALVKVMKESIHGSGCPHLLIRCGSPMPGDRLFGRRHQRIHRALARP